jgi:tRNA modification GTPase
MAFSTTDTIVAVATPQGRGGIGVVRVSGTDAVSVVRRLVARRRPFEPRRAHFTRVRCGPTAIDEAVVTFFPAPHSYTAEDVIEIAAHGSPVVLHAIVDAAIAGGARLAEPGEFTLRAYLNGRLDLMQAEAVADLIDAATPLQARAAFDQLEGTLTREISAIDATLLDLIARLEASVDFPEEGYHFIEPHEIVHAIDGIAASTSALIADARRGRLIREGFQVAIVGRPNVGKSTLFNALVGSARAIVTAVPGTTRDLVTETVDLMGFRVTLVDTAGIRDVDDIVEAEGVARSRNAVAVADVVLLVVDEDDPEVLRAELLRASGPTRTAKAVHVVVQGKSDLGRPARGVPVSAVTGEGLDDLRGTIVAAVAAVEPLSDPPAITNTRHAALLERAGQALSRAREAAGPADGALSEEFVLIDLQDARAALEEITGRRTPNDVIAHIFERFCVGK